MKKKRDKIGGAASLRGGWGKRQRGLAHFHFFILSEAAPTLLFPLPFQNEKEEGVEKEFQKIL